MLIELYKGGEKERFHIFYFKWVIESREREREKLVTSSLLFYLFKLNFFQIFWSKREWGEKNHTNYKVKKSWINWDKYI